MKNKGFIHKLNHNNLKTEGMYKINGKNLLRQLKSRCLNKNYIKGNLLENKTRNDPYRNRFDHISYLKHKVFIKREGSIC